MRRLSSAAKMTIKLFLIGEATGAISALFYCSTTARRGCIHGAEVCSSQMSFNLREEGGAAPLQSTDEHADIGNTNFTVDTMLDAAEQSTAANLGSDIPVSAIQGDVEEAKEVQADVDSEDSDWDDISKGRYFGAADDDTSGPLCHNCKQAGHKKRDCPHQLCRSCGALDDHDTMRCPMTQRCYNCSRLGHVVSKCPEPHRQQGSFCRECGSRSHLERSCPQIWRLYLPSPQFKLDGEWEVEAWCYNCAAQGHYGDDCSKPHRARLIEQSAFCQANQPESQAERSRREAAEREQSKRHQKFNEEDLKEDWFARQPVANGKASTRAASNYNSFQNGNSTSRYPPPPALSSASRGPRQDRRFDPYSRPGSKGPIITSERFPRGMRQTSPASNSRSHRRDSGPGKQKAEKRKPVPAAQRLANQNSRQSTRGGKAYRGGGRR